MDKVSAADLNLFRELFIGARSAAVVNGKKIFGAKDDDLFSDDLLLRHFRGECVVSAYFYEQPHRTPTQLAIEINTPTRDVALAKAIVAELADLGIQSYIEMKTRKVTFNIRAFFSGGLPNHTGYMAAWYASERARLRMAPKAIFTLYPKVDTERNPRNDGGFLELPFSPGGGCFVDPATMTPYKDQWGFLRSIIRNSAEIRFAAEHIALKAWSRRSHFDALGRPTPQGVEAGVTARPAYDGLPYQEARFLHDRIYFGPWRKPGASSNDILRGRNQLDNLLRSIKKSVNSSRENLPAVHLDLNRADGALRDQAKRGEDSDLTIRMDAALQYAHRAIDGLLASIGLPSHNTIEYAEHHQ